jgi:hypothetical protein
MTVPKRFIKLTAGKGPMDEGYLAALKDQYTRAIRDIV